MPLLPAAKSTSIDATMPAIKDRHARATSPAVRLNHLLGALPARELSRWKPHLELIDMPLGSVLYEAGERENYVYFPISVIVSLLYVMDNGDSAELALVGNEGIVGVSLFMGGNTTQSRAVVQNAGKGYRLQASIMKAEFDRAGPVMRLLLNYTQALMAQITQTAGCNKHHALDRQLCRWLLLSLDRMPGNELAMTQELIAKMLGVLPNRVTATILKLQKRRLIDYVKGHITVLDRPALERRSCECYEAVKREYRRLLPEGAAA